MEEGQLLFPVAEFDALCVVIGTKAWNTSHAKCAIVLLVSTLVLTDPTIKPGRFRHIQPNKGLHKSGPNSPESVKQQRDLSWLMRASFCMLWTWDISKVHLIQHDIRGFVGRIAKSEHYDVT